MEPLQLLVQRMKSYWLVWLVVKVGCKGRDQLQVELAQSAPKSGRVAQNQPSRGRAFLIYSVAH